MHCDQTRIGGDTSCFEQIPSLLTKKVLKNSLETLNAERGVEVYIFNNLFHGQVNREGKNVFR